MTKRLRISFGSLLGLILIFLILSSGLYSNSDDFQKILRSDDYYTLMALDYKNGSELYVLRQKIYKLLVKFPETCLCCTFPNNTRLYIYNEKPEKDMLETQIDHIQPILKIENFSGSPLSHTRYHQSTWFHSANLCRCIICNTLWFVMFEESDSDYYFIRLNEYEASLISNQFDWPNMQWPDHLKDWSAFLALKFKDWHELYVRNKRINENESNFFKIYDLIR